MKGKFSFGFNKIMDEGFSEEVDRYIKGRHRLLLAIVAAALILFLNYLALLKVVGESISHIITGTTLLLLILFLIADSNTRYFFSQIRKVKEKNALFINELFTEIGLNVVYTSGKKAKLVVNI